MATRSERPPASWWWKCAASGLAGGFAMCTYLMIAAWAMGMGFWLPLNMYAAAIPAFWPPGAEFALGPAVAGAALNAISAAFWGMILGSFGPAFLEGTSRPWLSTTLLGVGWGIALWFVMGLLIVPSLNPAMRMTHPQVITRLDPTMGLPHPLHYLVAHLVYGLVTALLLVAWTRRKELRDVFLPLIFEPKG